MTLHPLSRRDFLKRIALAGAAAAMAPSAYAGLFGKSRDQHTLAWFSDPHIDANASLIHRNVNMADQLAASIRELASWPVKPAAVIVNGDLALKDGQAGDYATFGKLIEPARALAPMHLTLGNHDQRENFWRAFPQDAGLQKAPPQRQCAVFSVQRANLFLLDSLEDTSQAPGILGEAQFLWLAQALSARPEKPAIIVAHHNLNPRGGTTGLKDSAALEEIFTRFPQIKAFIFGHTHNWEVSQHQTGVHLVNLPPTSYVFNGTRPNGWVRCTLAGDGAEFELRSLDVNHPEHAQVKKLLWRA